MYLKYTNNEINSQIPMYDIPILYNSLFKNGNSFVILLSGEDLQAEIRVELEDDLFTLYIDRNIKNESTVYDLLINSLIQGGALLPRNISAIFHDLEKMPRSFYILLDYYSLLYRVTSNILRSPVFFRKSRSLQNIQIFAAALLRYWLVKEKQRCLFKKYDSKEETNRHMIYRANNLDLGIIEYDFQTIVTRHIKGLKTDSDSYGNVSNTPENLIEFYKPFMKENIDEALIITTSLEMMEIAKTYGIYSIRLKYPDTNTIPTKIQIAPNSLSSVIFSLVTTFGKIVLFSDLQNSSNGFLLEKGDVIAEYPSVILRNPVLGKNRSKNADVLAVKLLILERVKELINDFTVL